MANQLLIYKNITNVNKEKHRDLYVKTGTDYSFAAEINSAPITAVEFPQAGSDYAIVFTGGEERVIPVVILGVDSKENLYFDKLTGWQGKYIPAFIRRYPFVFSSQDEGSTLTLCIDEEFSGCNTEGRGERLFDADGERTTYLSNVLKFLEEYQAHYYRTEAFCKKLVELELLEPMSAQFTAPEGSKKSLTGFMAINRAKLKTLTGDQLAELAKTDALELAYLHLNSLRKFSELLELSNNNAAKKAADTPAKTEAEPA